jgi:hypothetical protein
VACKERGRLELSAFLILIQSRDHDPKTIPGLDRIVPG